MLFCLKFHFSDNQLVCDQWTEEHTLLYSHSDAKAHLEIQKKIFLTKLKRHSDLFITGEFLYSQYRNKKENTEGTENLFLYRRIFVKSVLDVLEPHLTVRESQIFSF